MNKIHTCFAVTINSQVGTTYKYNVQYNPLSSLIQRKFVTFFTFHDYSTWLLNFNRTRSITESLLAFLDRNNIDDSFPKEKTQMDCVSEFDIKHSKREG